MVGIFFQGRQLLLTLLVVVITAILCGLGMWQWDRLQQRLALNERINTRMQEPALELRTPIDAEIFDYRRVELRGTFDNAQSVLLRNRSFEGTTGFHLITPLQLASGEAILVDRGWIPFTESDLTARKQYALAGEVTIIGVARISEAGRIGPIDPPFTPERPRLDAWFRVDIARISEQIGYPLLPIFVEVQPGAEFNPTPPIPAATSDLGPGSNLSYSIQWFSFAVILVVGYIALMLRKQSRS
jgi:surfeit locus 1 family protein